MTTFAQFATLIAGYLLTLILIRWVLLTRKRQPVATIAWILAIILLPLVGGILFLFFGINRVERRTARLQAAHRDIASRLPSLAAYSLTSVDSLYGRQRRVMRLIETCSDNIATDGNHIDVLIDTNIAMRRIEEAIESARESIHLEYYIWQPDRIGHRIRDLLCHKAREGVAIRFLYDGIGSLWLTRRFMKPMCDAGIQTAPFLPGQKFRERWSINLRNHRKIVIADGLVGFTGGMNIGDEYLGRKKRYGYWRDTHLRIAGPCVLQLQHIFAEDWFYATGEELTQPQRFPEPLPGGDMLAQVVSGGPDDQVRTFHLLMFTAINEARRQITLATSYFVPTDPLVSALESAAYRGVKVRLLLSGRSDHPVTVLAARSYYESLLRAGVEIAEYTRGIMHSKTLTIDGIWSLVGTPNFDARSLLLNFECAVAMYDNRIAEELEQHYEQDMQHARRINYDAWRKRRLREPLKENICRLFSPIL